MSCGVTRIDASCTAPFASTSNGATRVHRLGDRTISKYRDVAATQLGPACATGIVGGIGGPSDALLSAVTADWLAEFERVQLILRLSSKLRTRHND